MNISLICGLKRWHRCSGIDVVENSITESPTDILLRKNTNTLGDANATPTPLTVLEYTYGDFGEVTRVDVDSCGSGCDEEINYTYDGLGRMTERSGVDTGLEGSGKVKYSYNGAGRLTTFSFPVDGSNRYTRTWEYDAANRVTAVRDEDSGWRAIAEYRYNRASQKTEVFLGEGWPYYSAWGYDNITGQMNFIVHKEGANEELQLYYEYNDDGLRTKCTRSPYVGTTTHVDYEYDEMNRLKIEDGQDSSHQTLWKRQYYYDKTGNRTQLVKTEGGTPITWFYSYNTLKQLTEIFTLTPYHGKTYTYDANGNVSTMTERHYSGGWVNDVEWTYSWDVQDRLTQVVKDVAGSTANDKRVEYTYCPACGGAMRERIEYTYNNGWVVKSWLRYEYDGLNLLRIDERYDNETNPPDGIDGSDPWRPMNIFVHSPGAIGQIIKAKWFNYKDCTTSPCDSGWYYYFYDAVGNVVGIIDQNTNEFIEYEMDAFGNDLPGGSSFLAMDQPGPKEHLTGKMFDTVTGLYYFMARWYDPEVGRFVSRDALDGDISYTFVNNSPPEYIDYDGFKPRRTCSEREIDAALLGLRKALQREITRINSTRSWFRRPSGCTSWSTYLLSAGLQYLLDNQPKDVMKPCWDGRVVGGVNSITWSPTFGYGPPAPLETGGLRHQVTEWIPNCSGNEQFEVPINKVFDAWRLRTPFSGKGYLREYTMAEFRRRYPIDSQPR